MTSEKYKKTDFSNQLRSLMKQRKVTQKVLAEQMNVSQASVSGWLNGSVPTSDKLAAIANYFETSTDALLTGQEPNYQGRRDRLKGRIGSTNAIMDSLNVPPEYERIVFEALMLWSGEKEQSDELQKEWEKRREIIRELIILRDQLNKVINKIGEDII